MNEPILITEEELEYYTNPQILSEGNAGNSVHYLSEEEYIRDSQDCITLEEFSRLWEESINRIMPDP